MKKILCFGDSNTYGYTCQGGRFGADVRWTGRLSAALGKDFQLLEEGLPGRMVSSGNPLWPSADACTAMRSLLSQHEKLCAILIMLGSNDALLYPAEDIAAEMRRLLMLILGSGSRQKSAPLILLISPCQSRTAAYAATIAKLAPLYRALAAELGIAFADAATWGISLSEDGGHYDEAGHASFALHAEEELRRLLCRTK